MIKIVNWNQKINDIDRAEWFIKLGKLDTIDSAIIRGRRDRKYQFEVASEVNVSTETVKDRTKKLIKKYKKLMKEYPDILTIDKEYEEVCAIVNLITKNKIYTISFNNSEFDSFSDIRIKVMKEIEKQYKIKIEDISEYKVIVSGSYNYKKK